MAAPTQPNPASPSASAPSLTTPSELTWAYPFLDKDHKEIVDPQKFYEALSYMDDGFFPLGVNGFPHGGIHFGNASATQVDQASGMRCIADGEIVAYRVNAGYEHLQYADGKWAAYSTGFVLVRHHMTMAPAPDSTGAQPADEMHDVYSLYMHMADWNMYLNDVKLPRPFWWDVDAFAILGKDRQNPPPEGGPAGVAGAFVWTEPEVGNKKGTFRAGSQVGFLPEGSEVIVSEKRGDWAHIRTITAGAMCSATSGGYFGWEDKSVPWVVPDGVDIGSEASSAKKPPVTPEGDWGWLHMSGLQGTQEPKQIGQVFIPNPPMPVRAKTLLGQLGEYQDYERANLLPPTQRRRLLHLEVFADEGFSAFLTKCRARAAHLPEEDRTLLVVSAGAKLVENASPADRTLGRGNPISMAKPTDDSPASGPWAKVQPRVLNQGVVHMPDGPPVWIARENLPNPTSNTPAWSQFPLRLQNVADPTSGFPVIYSRLQLNALDGLSKAVDDRKVSWWRIFMCTAEGKSVRGWVCGTGHPNTKWESPWAWPGFEIVDATGINLTDAFKRNLIVTDSADWKEKKEFEPSAVTVNNSPLLLMLERTVAKEDVQKAGGKQTNEQSSKVTASAIQSAMRVPALAQALSHVILKYESEWGGNMSRWDAITPIMRNAKANWLKELERVRKMQWWSEVKGRVVGFPADTVVQHIHPVAIIRNFSSLGAICSCCGADLTITSDNLRRIFPNISDGSSNEFPSKLNRAFKKYEMNNCNRVAHFFGQCDVECSGFRKFKEDLTYPDGNRLWGIYTSALKNGLHRLHPDWSVQQMEIYTKTHLVNNDRELGMVLFGDDAHPDVDYRGRGLIHVTWLSNYYSYKNFSGIDVVTNPSKLEDDSYAATDSALWFWTIHGINSSADKNNPTNVTRVINPALKEIVRRKAAVRRAFEVINNGQQPCKYNWNVTSFGENGW